VYVVVYACRGRQTNDGVIFSKNVTDLSVLKEDDELAAQEAAAAVSVCVCVFECKHVLSAYMHRKF
jgi:hypothetical protein